MHALDSTKPPARQRSMPRPLGWLAALLFIYLAAPLVATLHEMALADWRGADLSRLIDATAVSVASASAATLVLALFGIPLGLWLARTRSRLAAPVGFISQLPLALPPLTSGILLLFLLGPYTPLGLLTQGALTDSFIGIVLAQIFVSAPFLIVAARVAFSNVDPVFEDVAATLGHRAARRFFAISLPLAWPAIRAGLLLAWLRAFGEFGATVMVAYHPYSLPVYTYVAFGSQGLPAMLPLLAPTLIVAIAIALAVAFSPNFSGARRRAVTNQTAADDDVDAVALLPRKTSATPNSGAAVHNGYPDRNHALNPRFENTHLDRTSALDPRLENTHPDGTHTLAPHLKNGQPDGSQAPDLSLENTHLTEAHALDLHFEATVGTFQLDVKWRTHARRLAIVGPSGSGKSLTLRLIAGLEAARVAELSIDGTALAPLPPEAREIAYVPQDYGLFPHLSVAQQLSFAVGAQAGASREWLAHLGLNGLEERLPAQLSLGQRQRVALARALVRPSRLLLLDEPFSALDTPRRAQLRRLLRQLQREISATTIVVTHDPVEAAQLADEVLILAEGRVLQSGPTALLFARPANTQVAQLLGLDGIGAGTVRADGTIAPLASLPGQLTAVPLKADAAGAWPVGTQVMWRIAAGTSQPVTAGPYQGVVEDFDDTHAWLRFGATLLECATSSAVHSVGQVVAFDVAPAAIEVWPLMAVPLSDKSVKTETA